MAESVSHYRPWRWLAFLPLVILPGLAAGVLEGPRLARTIGHDVSQRLAEAGQGWAKVSVDGRDVEIRGEAPGEAEAAQARAVAAATAGVRHVVMHVGIAQP